MRCSRGLQRAMVGDEWQVGTREQTRVVRADRISCGCCAGTVSFSQCISTGSSGPVPPPPPHARIGTHFPPPLAASPVPAPPLPAPASRLTPHISCPTSVLAQLLRKQLLLHTPSWRFYRAIAAASAAAAEGSTAGTVVYELRTRLLHVIQACRWETNLLAAFPVHTRKGTVGDRRRLARQLKDPRR